MAGFLDDFRRKVFSSVWQKEEDRAATTELDDKIALGVLMWAVAEADDKILPEEKEEIVTLLKDFGGIKEEDIPVVLSSIETAAAERIDLYTFTHEVSQDLTREVKVDIIKQLFRIACVDGDVDTAEHEIVRKVADLFRLDHKEFIDAKIEIKKETGTS